MQDFHINMMAASVGVIVFFIIIVVGFSIIRKREAAEAELRQSIIDNGFKDYFRKRRTCIR